MTNMTTTNEFQAAVNRCSSLKELKDTLNALEAELKIEFEGESNRPKLEDFVDISDLQIFGGDSIGCWEVYSWDENSYLWFDSLLSDEPWKISPRCEEIQ